MMVTVTVMLAPAAAFGEVVKIKGDGPGNLDFPETVATVQNGEATISGVVCDNPFPEVVHWYYDDGLEITWTLSRDGGGTWVSAPMKSRNEAFITLEQPACAARFRTVLYLATSNGGVSYGGCVANTWSSFSTGSGPMNVDAWNDADRAYTRPLYYYHNESGDDVYYTPGLLAGANGQCHAWADLLKECFLANNIQNVKRTRVLPPGDYRRFAVKNIAFDDADPAYPEDDPWKYSASDLNASIAGIPGQNMATPQLKLFLQHFVVHVGGTYYDPSYGVTTTGAADYSGRAVAAWETIGPHGPQWRRRETEPSLDLVFEDEDW
jgi:hypothetical protein